MVKVRGGMFSIEAHGQFAKSLVYQKNAFGSIVRVYRQNKVSSSIPALTQRAEYGNGSADWRTATPDIKKLYNNEAQGQSLSGFNIFLRQWFVYRYGCRYGLAKHGLSVLGMDREFENYPDRIPIMK